MSCSLRTSSHHQLPSPSLICLGRDLCVVSYSVEETVKILLVDDQPRNLDALESILDLGGCTFVRAQSADQALMATLQNDFAAIVLDIKMPGMDGLEVA